MNKWRHTTESTSYDGCSVLQCLSCKGYFTSAGIPSTEYAGCFKFCPLCGTRWEGEYDWGYQDIEWPGWNGNRESPDVDFMVWALQVATVWLQPDGSLKQLNRYAQEGKNNTWLPEIEWETDTIFVNASAKEIWEAKRLKMAEKDIPADPNDPKFLSEIQCVVRVIQLHPGDPSYKNAYVCRRDRFDKRYLDEYRAKWGGKKHYPEKERRWFRKVKNV